MKLRKWEGIIPEGRSLCVKTQSQSIPSEDLTIKDRIGIVLRIFDEKQRKDKERNILDFCDAMYGKENLTKDDVWKFIVEWEKIGITAFRGKYKDIK